MDQLLWLIPALPYTGALVLILAGASISRKAIPWVGAGSVGLAALVTFILGFSFIRSSEEAYNQTLWTWLSVSEFTPRIAFYLDSLSLTFVFVITFVGFLIHIYAASFMREDEGYARFFTYLNLFVGSMLILVLADNLLLLFFGWEGVGLCSYLLIGFWYQEEKNGYAARKAFIMTRIGDTALAIGLFMLIAHLNTLDIRDIQIEAPVLWKPGAYTATIIAFLLLGGAVGKSAQLPLQSWLPDAMAGPSPVSALIHAATMVTAGVYLIARMHIIFQLAPLAMEWVAIIGTATLTIAGFSALVQNDLKRILAYSTISQIGYMFLALGIGAWSAAIFHFMIHAFFKALLFLGAGAVIMLLHHEHNIFRMGGLRNRMPVVFWTFLIGASSLAALPVITAGFYSKDHILWLAFASENSNAWFFIFALGGAFITSLYTSRMVFVAFFGNEKTHVAHDADLLMKVPLIILAFLSLVGGFIELPHTLGRVTLFSDFITNSLPAISVSESVSDKEFLIQLLSAAFSLSGVYLAYYCYVEKPSLATRMQREMSILHRFWWSGWGFDKLYDILFIKPFVRASAVNKNDVVDRFYLGIERTATFFHHIFSTTQNGVMRWYMMGIVIGTIMVVTISLLINT